MMVCRECGRPREGAERTCPSCGADGWLAKAFYDSKPKVTAGEHAKPSGSAAVPEPLASPEAPAPRRESPVSTPEFVGCIIVGFALRLVLIKPTSVGDAALWGALFGVGTLSAYAILKTLLLRRR